MKKNECKLDIRLRIKIRFSFMGFWGFSNRTLTHNLQQARRAATALLFVKI